MSRVVDIDPEEHFLQTREVLDLVHNERIRQVEKWGVQDHPDVSGGDSSRFASSARADFWKVENDRRAAAGSLSWDGILLEELYEALAEVDPETIAEELVQVAAVAVAWVEDIRLRRNKKAA